MPQCAHQNIWRVDGIFDEWKPLSINWRLNDKQNRIRTFVGSPVWLQLAGNRAAMPVQPPCSLDEKIDRCKRADHVVEVQIQTLFDYLSGDENRWTLRPRPFAEATQN